MKKNLILLCLFLFSSSFSLLLISQNNEPILENQLFLQNEAYFQTIFSPSDIVKLKSAYVMQNEQNKFYIKSKKFNDKADEYKGYQTLPIAQSKINRYKKKENKYRLKASKYTIKELEIAFQANKIIRGVYQSNIITMNSKDHKKLIFELDKIKKNYDDSVLITKAKIAGVNDIQKANLMSEAFYYENKALLFMEYQFAVFQNDGVRTKLLYKKYTKNKPNNNNENDNIVYDPKKDIYLFTTKYDKIDLIFVYSKAEVEQISNFYKLGKSANSFILQANGIDNTIKKYDDSISNSNDFMQKQQLLSVKRDFEFKQISLKVDAMKKYIEANKTFYTCRKNHQYDLASKDTLNQEYTKAKAYFDSANIYFKDVERYLILANEKGGEEKLMSYEFANKQILSALAYQENGICVFLGIENFAVKSEITPPKQSENYMNFKNDFFSKKSSFLIFASIYAKNPVYNNAKICYINADNFYKDSERYYKISQTDITPADKENFNTIAIQQIKTAIGYINNGLNTFISKDTLLVQVKTTLPENFSQNTYLEVQKVYAERKNSFDALVVLNSSSPNLSASQEYLKKSTNYYKNAELNYNTAIKNKNAKSKKIQFVVAKDQMITALDYIDNGINLLSKKDTVFVIARHELKKVVIVENKDDNKKDDKVITKKEENNVNKITGLWVYSYSNPNPTQTGTPNGTIYRVYVGSDNYLLPINELREYGAIYYESTSGTNLKKFMVGSYTDKPSAEKTLNELKTKGYKDAKIITYTNGSKTGTTSNDNNQPLYDVYAPATDVSNLRVLTYVIQIGTFSNKKTADQLGNYNKYYINTLNDGKVQYFVGPYFRYDDAMNMYSSIKSKFSDAEVVAFNEGKTMTIANAKELEQASLKKNNDNNQTNTDELVYKVQVGAFSEKLSQEDINKKFGKLTSSFTLNTHTSDGMVKYSVGNTKSFEEAKKIRQNVVNLGFSDCFIIKFKNDKQVK